MIPTEIGKWYKKDYIDNRLCCYQGHGTGYGFDHLDRWTEEESMQCDNWKLATGKEVEQRLLEYAKEHYPIGTKYKDLISEREPVVKESFNYYNYTDADKHITDGCGGSVFLGGKWAEIISISKPETNESLLIEEAKSRYPIGTRFKDLYHGAVFNVSGSQFKLYDNGNIYAPVNRNNLGNNSARVYEHGCWAEVISRPEENTKFRKGDLVIVGDECECYKGGWWIERGEIVELGGKYWHDDSIGECLIEGCLAAISKQSREGNGAGSKERPKDFYLRHATKEERAHYRKVGIGANINDMNKIDSWCIWVNDNNRTVVEDWLRKENETAYNMQWSFLGTGWAGIYNGKGGTCFSKGEAGCLDGAYRWTDYYDKCITTEEFYKKIGHKPELPEYVEVVKSEAWHTDYVGKVFKIIDRYKKEGSILVEDWTDGMDRGLYKDDYKPSTKEAFEAQFKNEVYKAGNWVITEGYSIDYDGKPLMITTIKKAKYCYFVPCIRTTHNFSIDNIVRKALPHEIPKEYMSSNTCKDEPSPLDFTSKVGEAFLDSLIQERKVLFHERREEKAKEAIQATVKFTPLKRKSINSKLLRS